MGKFFSTLLGLAIISGATYAAGQKWLVAWSQRPLQLSQPVDVTLTTGTGLRHLSKSLYDKGAVSSGFLFNIYARIYS